VPRYPPCDSRLTIPSITLSLSFASSLAFRASRTAFARPSFLPSMSSNSSSVRCSNPINALFALLTRMSSSNFTWIAGGVTILRILDQEHHQKRDDGRTCVDHKLPSIREPEERAGNRPDHHGSESKDKHPGSTYFAGTDLRDFGEQLAEDPRLLGCPSAGGWWGGTVLFVWGSWHRQFHSDL